MNIDLASEDRWKRNFKAADGWAKFVRISIGMESEGWDPDPKRCRYDRLRRLAKACASKGMGMLVTIGGLPSAVAGPAWSKLGLTYKYEGKKYAEMPSGWSRAYVRWQQTAVRNLIEAYGTNAKNRIRFICLNEPYGRGEDGVVDALIDRLLFGLLNKEGTIRGCPVDFPTIWGNLAQVKGQLAWLESRTRRYPKTFGRLRDIPINVYLPSARKTDSASELSDRLVAHGKLTVGWAKSLLPGHEVYFSEFGVSRVWDTHGDTGKAAEVLLMSLRRLVPFVSSIATYQAADPTEEDERVAGFGLINMAGAPTLDLAQLRRLSKENQ